MQGARQSVDSHGYKGGISRKKRYKAETGQGLGLQVEGRIVSTQLCVFGTNVGITL